MAICVTCKKDKDEGLFYKRRDRPKGHTSSCKDCKLMRHKDKWTPRKQSAYKLKVNYGLTLGDYQSLLDKQRGFMRYLR